LTETFSNNGLAPNCIVMLAVEIKGFSCEAFRVARVAAVPIQYPFTLFDHGTYIPVSSARSIWQ